MVRPRNSCGSGLQNGQTPGQILINRPALPLSIPETQTDICSGSKTYTLTGLPSGATTTWSITNNYGVAGTSNPTNTSVQVNKLFSNNGHETLTATVTHCGFTYPVTKELNFGAPETSFDIFTYYPLYAECYEAQVFYIFRPTLVYNYDVYPPAYQWSWRVNGTTTENIVTSTSEDGVFIFNNPGTYDIIVRPANDCGVGTTTSVKTITVVDLCYGSRFSITASPNPTGGDLNVTLDKEAPEVKKLNKSEKVYYQLYDLNRANLVKQWTFDNSSNNRQLNVRGVKPGQYMLVVRKGKYQQSTQIIIK